MKPFLWILACGALWARWSLGAENPPPAPSLRTNDIIALIGGGSAEARARSAHWETLLIAAHPGHHLRILNLAREGDTVFSQLREVNYPSPLQQVATAKATVCVLDFGQGEAYDGLQHLEHFAERLNQWVLDCQALGTRVLLVTPIPVTRSNPPPIEAYAQRIRDIARRQNLPIIDVFEAAQSQKSLSIDGRKLTESGQAHVAANALKPWLHGLVVPQTDPTGRFPEPSWEALRQSVIARNALWKAYSRPTNWAFLAGDRTEQLSSRDHLDPKIRWFPKEMEQFVPLLQAADQKTDTLAALLTLLTRVTPLETAR
jgi:hypothetical protein